MRRWQEIYSGQDREVIARLRRQRRALPSEKLAFVIIDTNWRTLGPRGTPILEATKTTPLACGLAGWEAVAGMQKLLTACRDRRVPMVFVTGDAVTRHHMGRSSTKNDQRGPLDLKAEEMPEEIAPLPQELVVRKTRASAFFDTPLDNYLRLKKIDNLLVAGNSTSGCVRASVVDACSLGYNVFVVEECCYDRLELSHLVNLFDMDAKYADVITLEEALACLTQAQMTKSE
ncbi:MAG: isochorismatase family protein [Chloroflexi bacterium]|nr:isochorismatase family protein [Chloroflexota bacterium]